MDDNTLTPNLPDGVDRDEAAALEATWRALGGIDAPAPPTGRMRARLDAVVDAVHGTGGQASAFAEATADKPRVITFRMKGSRLALQGLAAAAVLLIGIGIGRYVAPRPVPLATGAPSSDTAQIAAMRSEVHDLREMVSLSLMQQQSASERIKGVSWTDRIDQPSDQIVASLLDTLMHDPNVNVRLATIDALERYASRDDVRRGTIEAVDHQLSPLVQIALIDFMVKTNERESVPTLRRLAMDPQADSTVRSRAQWGLQQLG